MLLDEEIQKLFFNFNDKVYEDGHLDGKTKDIIAISNSVIVDCLPCVKYHYKKAIEKGATIDEIKEAISVAIAVAGGNKFAKFTSLANELDKEHSFTHGSMRGKSPGGP